MLIWKLLRTPVSVTNTVTDQLLERIYKEVKQDKRLVQVTVGRNGESNKARIRFIFRL